MALTERLTRDLDGAFAELVVRYERAVFTTALRVSGREEDAEDLAAETFLRAYAALRGYPPERIAGLNLRPWLITVCLNQWRNQVRAASRRPRQQELAATDPVSSAESPPDHAQRRDTAGRLAALLQQLPDNQRVAVVLRHVVGLSYAELAEVLACPEGTAKSHTSRGLQRLRSLAPEVLP